ncbi:hypothetical protein PAESOLCIP111_06052 [Paenibacillus solanacearum]|uniref:Uncharacterized protein n=1 Tax=Paenibacillus solanacearum TaxID=2048548 RepID=A0A916K767_9BACL|nr:hypothetical protein PAESOLCIP111_06052 [Paenibacillus solanacearum]
MWLRIVLCLLGVLCVIVSFYFLVYFSWLLIVFCILGLFSLLWLTVTLVQDDAEHTKEEAI